MFVINKADHAGADRLASDLEGMLSLGGPRDWVPPIIPCVATEGKGLEALEEAIGRHRVFLGQGDRLASRRLTGLRARLLEILKDGLMRRLTTQDQGEAELPRCEGDVAARRVDPYTAARLMLERLAARSPLAGRGLCGARLDHLGIAVRRIDDRLRLYREVLGLEPSGIEEVPGEGVRVAFLPAGGTRVELVEPLGESSPVARFLERRGEGIHHVCFEVDDLAATLARFRAAGLEAAGEEGRPGAEGARIAFIHPRATGGVLIELREQGGEIRRGGATRTDPR